MCADVITNLFNSFKFVQNLDDKNRLQSALEVENYSESREDFTHRILVFFLGLYFPTKGLDKGTSQDSYDFRHIAGNNNRGSVEEIREWWSQVCVIMWFKVVATLLKP